MLWLRLLWMRYGKGKEEEKFHVLALTSFLQIYVAAQNTLMFSLIDI
jgi:hypothetical protein